jgi:biopolymer transport protein ExbB
MHRSLLVGCTTARATFAFALATLVLAGGADRISEAGGDAESGIETVADVAARYGRVIGRRALGWYRETPPADRVTWGGLAACAGLAGAVVLERLVRLRQERIVPRDFVVRYLERLNEGKLDRGKALDFCELNPSPAARVALAAVKRWGRPVVDLERAVAMAHRVEVAQLRRNVGTLRRVAALAPLLGLLGALMSVGRVLSTMGVASASAAPDWGPALAHALSPLTAAVALAILALVAYDGLSGRVEALAGVLDRLGAETVDTIAMAAPIEIPTSGGLIAHLAEPPRAPHQIRVEIPDALARSRLGRDEID